MENCYVLFVKTGFEERIAYDLKTRMDSSLFLPFVPTKEKYFKKNGNLHPEFEVCFQGYTFVESNFPADEFIIKISPYIRMLNGIYRIVSYGDKRDIAMREKERLALKNLYGAKYCIESSLGFIEGDLIKVKSGPLLGRESIIKKINRHKREATIEIEMMGGIRHITVGLEIVEKI